MKNYSGFACSAGMSRLVAIVLLACSFSANATAPRISAQLFGEERKADIVGYQSTSSEAKSESALAVEIVTEAFKVAGKSPIVDVLPSKQLAIYALFNNDAVALIGSPQDLAAKDKSRYRVVTVYLRGANEEQVSLLFSNERGADLYKTFVEGMQKILKSGKYLEILEKYHIKVSLDYVSRLKRHNPGWK